MVDLSSSLYMSTFTRVFCYSNLHKKNPVTLVSLTLHPQISRYPVIRWVTSADWITSRQIGQDIPSVCSSTGTMLSMHLLTSRGRGTTEGMLLKNRNQQIEQIWYDMIWYDMMATWCQLDRYPWKTRAVWSSSICSCDLIYWTTAAVGVQVRDRYEKSDCWTRSVPSSIAYLLLRSWLPKFTLWLFSIAMENHHF